MNYVIRFSDGQYLKRGRRWTDEVPKTDSLQKARLYTGLNHVKNSVKGTHYYAPLTDYEIVEVEIKEKQ